MVRYYSSHNAIIRSKTTNFQTNGLVIHTAFAITTEGLPLGLLDQKITSRPVFSEEIKTIKKSSHNITLPIEEKESIRWIDHKKRPTIYS